MWWRQSLKINKCRHFETNQNIRKLPQQIYIKLLKVPLKQFNWKKNATEFHNHHFKDLSSMLSFKRKVWLMANPRLYLNMPLRPACFVNTSFALSLLSPILRSMKIAFDKEIQGASKVWKTTLWLQRKCGNWNIRSRNMTHIHLQDTTAIKSRM